MTKEKVIIIVGPTATGKSRLAVEIASLIGGEVVSADSMQVYKYMDIGTAKPSISDRKGIPHFMIDVVEPDEDFNAGMYMEKARKLIEEIHERGKKAVIVGGTGLYIKALTRGIFRGPGKDERLRKNLLGEERLYGSGYLYERLKLIDPAISSRVHPKDMLRIVRALEVYCQTGRPLSQWQLAHSFKEEPYETLKIGIEVDRVELYKRIEDRVDAMVEKGLIGEVDCLLKMGYNPYLKSMQGLGYKEVCQFLAGDISLDEALFLIKRETRRYAKRQFTWFKRDEDVRWFSYDTPISHFIRELEDFLS